MVMAAVLAALWAASVYLGVRWRRRSTGPFRTMLLIVLCGSASLGVALFVMVATGVLG